MTHKKLLIPIISLVTCLMSIFTASAEDFQNSAVNSGDETNVFLIVAILVTAAAVAAVLVILGKKNNK